MDLKIFVAQLLKEKGSQIHGRVQLQKLVYFCKAMGADVNASYRLYIYGPYSQQVADTLQDCVADGILTESNGIIGEGTDYQLFLESIARTGDKLSDRSKNIIQDVISLCDGMTTRDLEITATTFFIDRQQKALFGADDKQMVIDKVTKAKGSRFDRNEIETSYRRVVDDFLPLEKKYASS